ncbi:hypothetical protein DICPUDRAFT_74459 [Dictyostelium purpureum]|uniref:palmitoyl-protein hydrolase n=1 Tax=Dictyostelium purpureum TaxID=5786 RepID=F0Z7T4_DICPU|nr:uncharacterized protein DICPUDRAFT_74459 [Dictyostelium purpureum]EGC40000.1 hypothetical protein DICPUDRAFT_74459 [Dictyostelium purpureum]|eukprot:XP_003283503.1 hypothetical protein DICPUDRAFT_74459 [Dictyostelium purpureum]
MINNISNILKTASVLQASSKHTATVIFMHGLGDTGRGWIDVMEMIQEKGNGHIKFICPTAPIQPVSINNGYRMNSWYDIKSLTSRGGENKHEVDSSKGIIENIISNEIENGIPSERILIGGFSQGCALSLYTFYTQKSTKLAGCLGLSGYMVLSSIFPELMKGTVNLNQPLRMFHGEDDEVVSFSWGQNAFETLKKEGANGEFFSLPFLGHSTCQEEYDLMTEFIKLRLPPQ